MPKLKSSNGFTLVELLVVVAIIALLMAVLLPSLNKAREAAKALRCQVNIRQLGQAEFMYESDNLSIAYDYSNASVTGSFRWYGAHTYGIKLEPYLGLTTDPNNANPADALSNNARMNSPLFCPEFAASRRLVITAGFDMANAGKVISNLIPWRAVGYGGSNCYPRNPLPFGTSSGAMPAGSVRTTKPKQPARLVWHFEGYGWPSGYVGYGSVWTNWNYSFHTYGNERSISLLFWDGHVAASNGNIFGTLNDNVYWGAAWGSWD